MYDFRKIEKKWQDIWAKKKFKPWLAEDFGRKPKRYVLDMFPYPSGEGLHVGHVEGYTASDIASRYYRMKGFNVLHPMGWDAFGLPAENYAIKTKTHPAKVVAKNVRRFKDQLQSLGFSYDWPREINTTDPEYYKWTQWIFLQLFRKGLAYETEAPVNWCPSCKTVLANEEVIDGRCERCSHLVDQKLLKQWLLKITAYADRLLDDLKDLDWPEPVKEMQRNWIGRSEGALLKFPVASAAGAEIEVFTTRPDTIFGATYMVLAPEHPLIKNLEMGGKIQNAEEVGKYLRKTAHKSERKRAEGKTGVELMGVKAINPANGKEIPIWAADYVLWGYGTGAIMAVPAHDRRDFEFAQRHGLPLLQVIKGGDLPYEGAGEMINSGQFNGLSSAEAKEKIIKALGADKRIQYKLRDWVFSRQRYWGEPIPIIKCQKCGNTAVPEKDLPVVLPKVENYEPTGQPESPLAAMEKWVKAKCPVCGDWARRETNTMPQWAGSNWYYLAYALGAKNLRAKIKNKNLADREFRRIFDYWLPVDLYVGGVEHAVLHLLYARFWHKFLFDLGVVSQKEPFLKLVNQGLILGSDGQKMSKSRGNVINPDELVEKFGADSLRLYEMFMGPLEASKPWDVKGIIGMFRFLTRVYELRIRSKGRRKEKEEDEGLRRLLHRTIKKVTEDIEGFRFNTAISALMVFSNEMEKAVSASSPQAVFIPDSYWQIFAKLLFPLAPHLGQEIWKMSKGRGLLDAESWPVWNEKFLAAAFFTLVIQINGKVRDKVKAEAGLGEQDAIALALGQERIKNFLGSREPEKIIYIPDRIINIVI